MKITCFVTFVKTDTFILIQYNFDVYYKLAKCKMIVKSKNKYHT